MEHRISPRAGRHQNERGPRPFGTKLEDGVEFMKDLLENNWQPLILLRDEWFSKSTAFWGAGNERQWESLVTFSDLAQSFHRVSVGARTLRTASSSQP